MTGDGPAEPSPQTLEIPQTKASELSLAFLLSGNMIGSGLLALPVVAGLAGFLPAVVGILIAWALMTFSGLVLCEHITKKKQEQFDIPSFFHECLGNKGRWLAISANLLLLYGLLVAYLEGAGTIIGKSLFGGDVATLPIIFVYFVIASGLVARGMHLVQMGNNLMMVVLLSSFAVLAFTTGQRAEAVNLEHGNPLFLALALPVLVNSFNCHNVIPTVCREVAFDRKKARRVVVMGIGLGLVVNLSWCVLAIAAMPYTELVATFQANEPVTVALARADTSGVLSIVAVIFGLVALSTSYVTVGASLLAFLRDLRKEKLSEGGGVDLVLAFLPPLVIVCIFPDAFVAVQSFIGGFGIAVLFGVLPAWVSARHGASKSFRLLGWVAAPVFLAVVFSVFLQDMRLFDIPP